MVIKIKHKCVMVTQKILSYAMFFNFPLIYFIIVNFDLTISAILATRNASRQLDDSRSFISTTTFRVVSVVLAWVYFIAFAVFMFALLYVISVAKDLWAVSNRIGFIKFGSRFHSKRPVVVFLVWFFTL